MVAVYLLFLVMLLVNGTLLPAVTDDSSNKPGCYKVGKYKKPQKKQKSQQIFLSKVTPGESVSEIASRLK